jgi:multiple sugar transport system substrate-binding protein
LVEEARILLRKRLVSDGFVWQGAPYEGLTCVWTEFAADTGVETTNARDLALQITSPRSLKALTFMDTLLASGVSPADVTNMREPQSEQIFESGHAAFLRTWSSEYVDLAKLVGSPVRGKVGVAPLPTFEGVQAAGASTIGGWDLYVNPHTKHLPEVLTFVKWMTDFPAQYTLAQYSIIPTNAAVRSDQTLADHPIFEALRSMQPVHRPSGTPIYPAMSMVIYSDVHRALLGSVTPTVALQEARRQLGRIPAAGSRYGG